MPYTEKNHRENLDCHIDAVRNALREIVSDDPSVNFEELVSYVIMQIIESCYKRDFSSVIEVNGLLEVVKMEYNRIVTNSIMIQRAFETDDPFDK